jgi:hypothetical protein
MGVLCLVTCCVVIANHHIINNLNEILVLLGFHAYIKEMHGSRNKIPSKKSRQAALRGGI